MNTNMLQRKQCSATKMLKLVDHLDVQSLMGLIEGTLLCVVVKKFASTQQCKVMTHTLTCDNEYGEYANAHGIGRVKEAFYESNGDIEARNRYFSKALGRIQQVRSSIGDLKSPIDTFRLQLDEMWSKGARLMRLETGPMFVGLARSLESGAYIHPHQDELSLDAPDSYLAQDVLMQLGCNIFLEAPRNGGELELWDVHFSQDEYESRLLIEDGERSYGLDRSLIPKPDMAVLPEVGDLVIMNASKVHAVRPAYGLRFTMSCFVGFCGVNLPLVYWS